MNRIVILGIALAIAAAGQAAAASFRYFGTSESAVVVSGEVDSDGMVLRGTGFVAKRLGVGEYIITFAKGIFPSGCPAGMTVTDAEDVAIPPAAEVFQGTCSRKLQVTFRGGSGFADTPFMFVAANAL
jgi:hypothetical protein